MGTAAASSATARCAALVVVLLISLQAAYGGLCAKTCMHACPYCCQPLLHSARQNPARCRAGGAAPAYARPGCAARDMPTSFPNVMYICRKLFAKPKHLPPTAAARPMVVEAETPADAAAYTAAIAAAQACGPSGTITIAGGANATCPSKSVPVVLTAAPNSSAVQACVRVWSGNPNSWCFVGIRICPVPLVNGTATLNFKPCWQVSALFQKLLGLVQCAARAHCALAVCARRCAHTALKTTAEESAVCVC